MRLFIIDTKACNLNSVVQAVKRLGLEPEVSNDPAELTKADKYILPGVGTASAVMDGIEKFHLKDLILGTKKPLLGICLGMQVQALSSAEVPLECTDSEIPTLGIINAQVQKIESHGLRLPHMGWNTVEHNEHPLFAGIEQNSYFYFVHSYCIPVCDNTIGRSEYGMPFSAAVAKDNFMGVQFHPEKSGAIGARLLQNFINL